MRRQSTVQVTVRGRVVGGAWPLICLPLVAGERAELCREAREIAAMQPDLVEWRVDAFTGAGDMKQCLTVLEELRAILGETPLIFTCRSDREGGLQHMTEDSRSALILRAMDSGQVDLVDIELASEWQFIQEIETKAKALGVKLILSSHNFQETPAAEALLARLVEAEKMGADIAKIAVMPKSCQDVLTLLAVTDRARSGQVAIPIITISMGEQGKISRLAGGLFGSDITFGAGRESSAPGQLSFPELKTGMALLYGQTS